MKKIVMTLLMSVGLLAEGEIANIYDKEPYYEDYSGAYIGGSIVFDEVYADGYSDWFSNSDYAETGFGGQVQVGYTILGNAQWLIGVEGRGGVASSDTVDGTWLAAYARGDFQIEKFKIYGLLGYGVTDLSTSAYLYDSTVLTISDNNSDLTYGAGIAYDFSNEIQIFADYVQLPVIPFVESEDIDFDVISIGMNYKF